MAITRRYPLMLALVGCSTATSNPHPSTTDASDLPTTGFFVAPDGDDSAAGSVEAPFATVQRAVEAMRSSSEKQTHVRAGVYEQRGQTIALDARDNGIELLAYPHETPVLSGGFKIAHWT